MSEMSEPPCKQAGKQRDAYAYVWVEEFLEGLVCGQLLQQPGSCLKKSFMCLMLEV